MLINKNITFSQIIAWTWQNILKLSLIASAFAFLYAYDLMPIFLPSLPVSVIGAAVAFYLGFKNNSAYDRMWEARKLSLIHI